MFDLLDISLQCSIIWHSSKVINLTVITKYGNTK